MAAHRSVQLVLASRSEDTLQQLTDEITRNGGNAIYVVADAGKHEDVGKIARAAQAAFGGFDTWVNNAGVSIYGKLRDVPVADMRQLFETNFWGVVYGSLEAATHLKRNGGAVNWVRLGSGVWSSRAPRRVARP